MDLKKVQKYIEAINTYYGFAVLAYVAILYVASHNHLFWWILLALTPLLAGWTGSLIYGFWLRRHQRYGFRVIADAMTYEILGSHNYSLRYTTTLKADENHLFTYPIGYQWSGKGEESLPRLLDPDQKLLGVVHTNEKDDSVNVAPYRENVTNEGEWKFWLVGLSQPVYKGEIVQVKYAQDFNDKKGAAKPYLYYCVRTSMERLELNVKFPDEKPKTVYGSYIKPTDTRRAILADGVQYDPEKQWAAWVIHKPKIGYTYRIQWQ